MSGNTSDKKYFQELVVEYGHQIRDQFGDDKVFVFDSAYCTEDNMERTGNEIDWITRVPFTVKQAKELRDDLLLEFNPCQDLQDYATASVNTTFGGVEQRWIVVHSEGKLERDTKSLHKAIDKEKEGIDSSHSEKNKLQRQEFQSETDARKEIQKFASQLHYHGVTEYILREKKKRIDGKRGRLGKDTPYQVVYSTNISVGQDPSRIARHLLTEGRFIIATNLSSDEISDEEVLLAFKSQQNVERGFRFLKDPFFFARSIFLEKPERISSLAMLMGISLLIYNLCELKLREALLQSKQKFEDPTLKPTEKPTIRRVFQTFMGIHIHYTTWKGELVREVALNIKPWHIQVIKLMGEEYYERYKDGLYRKEKFVEAITSKHV
jgi:transposase